MLVQGFIDLVGHVLCGSDSNDYVQIMGGARAKCSDIVCAKPTYTWTGEFASSLANVVRIQSNLKYIYLGTSDTPPQSTDCEIQDEDYVKTGTVSVSSNKVVVTGTYTNETTESKTFKEIGLSTMGYYGDSSYSILLSRSVFSEPVVIPAGESKSFTITIDFNKFADTVVTA